MTMAYIIYVKQFLKNKYYCVSVDQNDYKVTDCKEITKTAYYNQSKNLRYVYPININFTKNFPYFGNVYAYFAEK